jgi:hypothetical protein
MKPEAARNQIKRMLRSFTAGSVLHLLGEVMDQSAEEARAGGDETRAEQCRTVAATLFTVGLGVDAACPR